MRTHVLFVFTNSILFFSKLNSASNEVDNLRALAALLYPNYRADESHRIDRRDISDEEENTAIDSEETVFKGKNHFLKPVDRTYLEWAREEALNDAKLFIRAYRRWGKKEAGAKRRAPRRARFSPRHLPLFK